MTLFYVLLMLFLFFHAFHFFIYVFHYSAKIKFDSHDSLPLEKALTFYNNHSVFNNVRNNYYYNTFLGKGLYEQTKNNDNKYR